MKILVVGQGGREHAIGQMLAQSKHQPELFFAPGNPGMAALGQRLDIEVNDIQGLVLFAQREGMDLTVVGPEVPLALGIVDQFQKAGLLVFGPTQAGAQIESSKVFAKQLMRDHQIPTAHYYFCETWHEAQKALDAFQAPYVVKEDGLAAGKGVTIAQNRKEAEEAIEQAFENSMSVVIEEFLQGQELSILALCDGQRAIPLISAQDFKKAYAGNQGPNTGGMGAYAPVPLATPTLLAQVQTQVLTPTVQALKAQGIDYRGILYAGLMVDPDGGLKVLEFNARFGDPETQVVLPLLEDDLVDLMLASAQGDLSAYEGGIRFKPQHAVTVVLASEGYPGSYQTGLPIQFPEYIPDNARIFHAGTRIMPDQTIVSAGGRVLNVTGLGATLEEARQQAYTIVDQIHFDTKQFRPDIAEHPAMPPVRA